VYTPDPNEHAVIWCYTRIGLYRYTMVSFLRGQKGIGVYTLIADEQ